MRPVKILEREEFTDSASEKQKKELIYLAAWSILKELQSEGLLSKETVEKINRKNAETMGCKQVAI